MGGKILGHLMHRVKIHWLGLAVDDRQLKFDACLIRPLPLRRDDKPLVNGPIQIIDMHADSPRLA